MVARLAKVTGATVIPVHVIYCENNHKYRVNLLPPLIVNKLNNKQDEAIQLNQTVEDIIRLSPEQYMWFLRIFKTHPNGQEGFYSKSVLKFNPSSTTKKQEE